MSAPEAAPLTPSEWEALALAAEEARARAYAPYSRYQVGAALLTTSGEVVRGCNVENASYPLTQCAEACAVGHAVSLGLRSFRAVAVATPGPEAGAPCGACRQILAEFSLELQVALVVGGRVVTVTTVRELLPLAFTPSVLASSGAG